jgi:hypothetical protein
VSTALVDGCRPQEPTAGSDADERRQLRAEFFAASSSAELSQVLRRYNTLWQLPGTALLLSEQLLAGLPCDWCCNNPGCINTAGPSERVLVGGKSCKCAGCRTARWVLGTWLIVKYFICAVRSNERLCWLG